ncbi:MAG: MBL fold metallo-hydrolase [Thermoplasmata archaeon]|nr:MAG: MBL fold metallo-hydrolase [Thermoplasmata archaeon]
MPYLKVLVEGYAKKLKNGWEGNSTCVFLQNEGNFVVIDPGMDEKALIMALKNEGIKKERIDYVFLTHYHIDHMLNVTLFKNAAIVDGYYVYEGRKGTEHDGVIFGKDVEIVHTPGHTPEHSSLFVNIEGKKYAVAGDAIWWYGKREENLINLPDPFAYDMPMLLKSREKIIKKADYIIPGHGKMMKISSPKF